MPQITIYLPDRLAQDIRQQAKAKGKSLSAYFAALARKSVHPQTWPSEFVQLYGSCAGTLIMGDDQPPEDVDSL